MEQLQVTHPPLEPWLKQLRAADTGDMDLDPLASGWRALAAALGLPDYPIQVDRNAEETAAWYTACPYPGPMQLGLTVTRAWLDWSWKARETGRLPASAEHFRSWCKVFDNLSEVLPDGETMQLHHRLWESRIGWQWLGDGKTRIGVGVRQVVIESADRAPPIDNPDDWRVPIYTVTGSVGKTTTVRLLHQLLQPGGRRLAVTASDGAWIGEQQVAKRDSIGGVTAHALLQSPQVEAALFEQGRRGILNQGVPYSRSDMAVLLNIQPVHLGIRGIETVEQMAEVKALGLRPARLAVLNHDDTQCRRIGAQRSADSCIWFSVAADTETLRALSGNSGGATGIERDGNGKPQAIVIWRNGQPEGHFSLDGVVPYHGMLGEKTLEELLAAVTAAWFGPLKVEDWDTRLPALRLDSGNHLFRTSVHRQDKVVFVLDKAGEAASLNILHEAIEEIARREEIDRRILVVTRPAAEPPELHCDSARTLYPFMDEFVCFDRPDTYAGAAALPIYEPGSIPLLLRDEFFRLNAESGADKPVTVLEDWTATEAYLRKRLAEPNGKTLVLINQPSTGVQELNDSIVEFVTGRAAIADG